MELTTKKPTTVVPRTRTPRTTIPVTELPKTIVPTMEVLRTVVPRTVVPRVSNKPLYSSKQYNRTNTQVSPFSDYNDPTQINSFADVLWNSLSKNSNLKTRDYGILSLVGDADIPLLSRTARTLTGTIDLARNTVIEPIKQKQPLALGINALVNLGESLDILASPIKGLLIDGPEGLIKGSIGRVNYDLDTGNKLLDIVGEIFLDPFNWASLGGKAILSKGAKAILTSTADDIAQAAGGKIFKETVSEASKNRLKKDLIKTARRELFDSHGKFIAKSSDDVFDALIRASNRMGTEYLDDAFIEAITNRQIAKMAPLHISNLNILKGISGIVDVADTAEGVLFRGAMYSNFIPVDLLKRVKNIGVFKNYVNKVITEVGQTVNGFINPRELTKLANYEIVTNPKKLDFMKMHVNQILTKGGLDWMTYIDIDKAFSERALDDAREVARLIKEYSETQDYDTFIKQVGNILVPEDILKEFSDPYLAIINTLDQDLNLIATNVNKDGIKVFQNISEVYKELKNNIVNVYELNKALSSVRDARTKAITKDLILTPTQIEYINKYSTRTLNYSNNYKKALNKVSEGLKITDQLIANKETSETIIKNTVDKLIRDLTKVKQSNKITDDVQQFIAPFIKKLQVCKTAEELASVLKDTSDRLMFQLQSINDVFSRSLVFKAQKELPIKDVRKESRIYSQKSNYLKAINMELHVSFDIPEERLSETVQNLLDTIIEPLSKLPKDSSKYYKDVYKKLITLQDKLKNNIIDAFTIKQDLKSLQKFLNDSAEIADNVVEFCNRTLSNTGAIKDYRRIAKTIYKKKRALSSEYYRTRLVELREACAGGMSAFNKIIEQANKRQFLGDLTKPTLKIGLDNLRELRQTVADVSTQASTTIASPVAAEYVFKSFFGTKDEVVNSETYALLERLVKYGDLSYNDGPQSFIETCEDCLSAIAYIREQLVIDPDFLSTFGDNFRLVQDLFETLKQVQHNAQTYLASIEKTKDRLLTVAYDADGKPIKTTSKFRRTIDTETDEVIDEGYISWDEYNDLKERGEGFIEENDYWFEKTGDYSYYDAETKTRTSKKEWYDSHNLDYDSSTPDYKTYIFDKQTELMELGATEYSELQQLIDNADLELSQISKYETNNKLFKAGAVSVMYAAKDENVALLLNSLSSDIGIGTEMGHFMDPTSLPAKELKALIEDTNTELGTRLAAEQLYNDVAQFRALDNFVRRLTTDSDIPDGVLRAVLSSLESFKNMRLCDFELDRFPKELYKRIKNFIYGIDAPKSLSVENLLTEASIKIQHDPKIKSKFEKEFTKAERDKFQYFLEHGETHISEDDTFVQEMLIRLFIPDTYVSKVLVNAKGERIFYNKNGGNLWISDCETSSKHGPINEIAIKTFGKDNCVTFKVAYHNDWEIPQRQIIKKMFPKDSEEIALRKYKELYNPNSAINKQAIANGTLVFCDSEKEMLEAYSKYVKDLQLGDEVIMHNGTEFDYPVIMQRAFENDVELKYSKIKLSDSLVGMKENMPLINLDSSMQIKINNYIQQYINELPEEGSLTFLSATNSSTLKNITELHKILTSDQVNSTYSKSLITALDKLKSKYYTCLSTNEKISKGTEKILISKEFFQTKEGQELFISEVKSAIKATEDMLKKDLTVIQRAEYEQYLKSLQDTLELEKLGLVSNNISRTMYINRFEGAPAFGFWRAVDLDTARNYMDIPDDALLTTDEMKAITNFVRPIQNTYDAIRNTKLLIDNKDNIATALQDIIKAFDELPTAPTWLKYIKINKEDYKTNYVILQKLYNKFLKDLESQIKTSNIKGISKEIIGPKQKYINDEIQEVIETLQTSLEVDINKRYKYISDRVNKIIKDDEILQLLKKDNNVLFEKLSPEFNVFDTIEGQAEYVQRFSDSITNTEFYDLSQTYSKYKDNFNNIINKGLTALSDTIDGTAFTSAFKFKTAQQANKLSEAIDSFSAYLKTLPVEEQFKVIKNIEESSDLMKVYVAKQILELPEDDLLNFLLTDSMLLQIETKAIRDFDVNILTTFVKRKNVLQEKGIEIDFNKDTGILTVYPNKSVKFKTAIDPVTGDSIYEVNGKVIERTQLLNINTGDFLGYLPENIKNNFKVAQESINTLTNNVGAGTTYEIVGKNFYTKVYENLPEHIKNNMLSINCFTQDALFNKRTRFNTTLLGNQKFCRMYGDYVPGNFIKGYVNSFITLASRASDKANYIEMILHKDFSINNGVINELSFDELRKTLEDAPEFNLACLVYNHSGELELIDLKLNTEVDFQFAKKNNAVILPYHVFATAYQVINSKTYEEMSPVVRLMTKAMHAYKRGYLMSGGMIMRNAIDTFAKNLNMAQGDVVEALSKTMDAMKLYMSYNDTLNSIFKSNAYQRINKETISTFFASGINKMTYEEFSFVHEVLNSGALIGEVKALDNYRLFSKARKEGIDVSLIDDLNDYRIKFLQEDYESVKHSLNGLMRVNNDIENIQRLSAYMLLQDQGLNFTQSVYRVAKDHFNYSMKSPREKLIELIIPFYTFKLNNLQYWAETLVDNPWIAGVFEDIMTPIWDFDDVDEKELQYNRSLQYRILSGNMQLADNGLTLKLNPSASDAFKLMTNPLGEIYNSIFSVYTFATDAAMTQLAETTGSSIVQSINQGLNIYKPANPTKLDTIKSVINLFPYGAILQRYISGYQYAQEIGNPLPAILPSIFGRTKQYEPFKPRNYNRNYTKRSYNKRSYTKVPYPKKVYPKRTYAKKYYSKKPYPKYGTYDKQYPTNFKNIYIDGMYSVPNINTYVPKANRYYHFSRLNKLPTVSIYDKLYNSRGKSRWDAMLQPTSSQNLKYVIKNTIHYK